ncbi:tRNA-(MS[2]IO[6]A)-hydroxylase MiaE-like protein [Thiogranum longum]|uniref:tRNA-(MS[2]IO[6]A)-hydroxylase MiaE-like protein n=1 Tax=Thiogranum longum TaxID=1537524 RepID=A0A4R1HPJ6_9GAMM|nr:ferritin-like domain-containing protein [Thiogranum longum]TCK19202.1 tRNA-(MS[2]IO[6]A)-hydroxylase MiaE-like protein [Thiogranum longum]
MNTIHYDPAYARAMGHLLVLYTQVDQFIMEVCAARIATAPDTEARMGLAKQVGDECRHVSIQNDWISKLGIDPQPVIPSVELDRLHTRFRELEWVDFLTDLYLVIEALGSQAVEQVVPLADPGTRESLRIPLQDELDHVAFGLSELRKVLNAMSPSKRAATLANMPRRVDNLVAQLEALQLPVMDWFEAVGTRREQMMQVLDSRQDELIAQLAA